MRSIEAKLKGKEKEIKELEECVLD